jgi:hypothetical protein
MVYFFRYPTRGDGDIFEDPLGLFFLITGGLVAIMLIAYPLTLWLLKDTNFPLFLLRFLGVVLLLVGVWFCTRPFLLPHGDANIVVALLLYIAWLSLSVVITAGVFVISFSMILGLTEILLVMVRGIAWRIVEYNKGAFAAMILILPLALV